MMTLTDAGNMGVWLAFSVTLRDYGSDRVSPLTWTQRMSLFIGYIRYCRGIT